MPRSVKEWIGKTDDSMPGDIVRDRISKRQGDRCACCGRPFGPGLTAHCDHVRALADGGENRERNLQMLCNWCHVEKSADEATSRAKNRRIRAKHLGFDTVRTNRWSSRGFDPAAPQRRATTPIAGKFDGDITSQPPARSIETP